MKKATLDLVKKAMGNQFTATVLLKLQQRLRPENEFDVFMSNFDVRNVNWHKTITSGGGFDFRFLDDKDYDMQYPEFCVLLPDKVSERFVFKTDGKTLKDLASYEVQSQYYGEVALFLNKNAECEHLAEEFLLGNHKFSDWIDETYIVDDGEGGRYQEGEFYRKKIDEDDFYFQDVFVENEKLEECDRETIRMIIADSRGYR